MPSNMTGFVKPPLARWKHGTKAIGAKKLNAINFDLSISLKLSEINNGAKKNNPPRLK